MLCGIDIGSTTCKYVLCSDAGEIVARDYARHGSRQAEKLFEFVTDLERRHGLEPGRDTVVMTGSGAGPLAPLLGARVVQEVVAVAVAVERLHPRVRFVSEIGGEDMKTIFFSSAGPLRNRQVFMQSACSGGTGTFIEKTARKLGVADRLPEMAYRDLTLHRVSSKCGIFAESDANTLAKAAVPTEEIVASLFEAVVYQNLATLTKGNTPAPEVLLLGGPNLFFKGLQEAWRVHLERIWEERGVELPEGDRRSLVVVPEDAQYYAALGCLEMARKVSDDTGRYAGCGRLEWWIREGQLEQKLRQGRRGWCGDAGELDRFKRSYTPAPRPAVEPRALDACIVGCDFGSTTAKAVCLDPAGEIVYSCYALSVGNPLEDARALFRELRRAGVRDILGVGITGYGAAVLQSIVGADVSLVETVAHANAALHFFPDADCVCDVGGVDVKILLIKNGVVSDFRLNSQCSSGNGAFLQGVAERFEIPLAEIATHAFRAQAMPSLAMGCGVFLQSDIVNQQRRGWQPEEILAGLCNVLPQNVWLYAGELNNLRAAGRKFVLQGGTHRNLAVVKSQVDFIRERVPEAEIVVHPWSGEAGAIGAALETRDHWSAGNATTFRGLPALEALNHHTTTSPDTQCRWCPVHCMRSFVDVELPGGAGRPWSKVPLEAGWERVIINNSCPRGLVEDAREVRSVKTAMDRKKEAFPSVVDAVRKAAFRSAAVGRP